MIESLNTRCCASCWGRAKRCLGVVVAVLLLSTNHPAAREEETVTNCLEDRSELALVKKG